jgi:hypothetical protein
MALNIRWTTRADIKLDQLINGSKETAELPKDLRTVASNLIGWNSIDKIGDIISGKNYPMEGPDGNPSADLFERPVIRC